MSTSRNGWASSLQDASNELANANNRFAIRFLQTVEGDKPRANQIVSPFSIESALLMTMEGARGQTADQMGQALGLHESLKQKNTETPWNLTTIRHAMKKAHHGLYRSGTESDNPLRKQLESLRSEFANANAKAKELLQSGKYSEANAQSRKAQGLANEINQLGKSIDQYDLRIANSIWADESHPVLSEFRETLQEFYGAEVENVNFRGDAETQRGRINAWVSEHTEHKINDLIPPGMLTAMTRMVLANAVYFRGTWQEPFDEAQTSAKTFYNQGATASQVPTMSKLYKGGRYGAFNSDGTPFSTPRTLSDGASPDQGYPKDGFQVVELPYNGDDLSMLVVLPSRRDGLTALIRDLTAEQLERWESALQKRDVSVQIPKFKLEVNYNLKETLRKLGMNAPFTPGSANFSGISQEELVISDVLHKASIEVNEKGTEAAAATAVIMERTSAFLQPPFIPQFHADHPFLFLIRNRQTGMVLFLGKLESLA
jgi:serpin B